MAGAALGTAYIKIAPDMTGVQGKVAAGFKGVGDKVESQISGELKGGGKKLSASMSALMGAVGGVAASFANTAINKISGLTGAMAEASDSADKFRQGLGFAGLDTSKIEELTASTQKYADETVYDLADIRNATMQLASNGVPNYDKLAEAAGNLNAVVGGNKDTFKSVAQAMVQTAGTGKLTTENWNQITDAIGGAAGPLQEELKKAGAYTGNFRDAMAKGEITAEEFNNALLALGFDQAAVDAAKSTSTIEGAMGNLEASIVSVGSGILDKVKPHLTSAISGIGEFIQGAAGPISDALGAVFGIVGELAKPLGGIITGVIKPIADAMGQIMPSLMGFVQTILPPIQQALTALTPVLTTIATTIGQALVNVVNMLLPPIQNLAMTILPPLVTFIQTILAPWIEKISEIVLNVINAILPVIEGAINTITSIIQFFIDLFSGNWSKLGEDIKNIWNSLWDTVGKIISGAIDVIAGLVQGVWETIKSIFGGMWDGLVGVLNSLWENIVNFFKGIPKAIGDALGTIGDVGKNLVEGLWNGISNAAGWVLDKIKGFGESILNGIKGFFGIKSPSRVMRDQIGKNIALGMADGITKNQNAVDNAMAGLEQSAMAQFKNIDSNLQTSITTNAGLGLGTPSQAVVSPRVIVNQNIESVGDNVDVTELGYMMGYQASQGVQQVASPNIAGSII